jgi:sulfide:quinone oxidoreductase
VAARLCRHIEDPRVTIIDPEQLHYYQPGFTMIAAGVFSPESVVRPQMDIIPSRVKWLKDRVVSIDPDRNSLHTADSGKLSYDFLVLAPGIEMHFDAIDGIQREKLGEGNVHCIYDYRSAGKCWQAIQNLAETGGRALFTNTWTKLKCGGAPKKICLLAEDHVRSRGRREAVDFRFISAKENLFSLPLYRRRLEQIYEERKIPAVFGHRIRSVDTSAGRVVFEVPCEGGASKYVSETFDFLHIVPPMSAPSFVRESALALNPSTGEAEDWVPTDPETLVHACYKNVMVVGDAAGLPTSKTAAAIRSQAPVATGNLLSIIEGASPSLRYDGYTACPVTTEYGKVLLAEFDYSKKPAPSIPFLKTGREHSLGWQLKKNLLPELYFEGMLRGLA